MIGLIENLLIDIYEVLWYDSCQLREVIMGLFDSFHSSSFSTHQDQCGSCAKSVVSQTSLTCYCEKYRDTYKLDDEACKYFEY